MPARPSSRRPLRWTRLALVFLVLLPAMAITVSTPDVSARRDRDRVDLRIVKKASKGRLWVIGRKPASRLRASRLKKVYMRNAHSMLRNMTSRRGRAVSTAAIGENCPAGYDQSSAFSDTETQVYHPFKVPGVSDFVQVWFGSEAYWNRNFAGTVTDSTICGTSFASWVGSDPYDADGIEINNFWTQEGSQVTFTAGIPSGVGIEVSGSEKYAQFPMNCGRGSYCQSDYSGFAWKGSLTTLSQTAQGVFRFSEGAGQRAPAEACG